MSCARRPLVRLTNLAVLLAFLALAPGLRAQVPIVVNTDGSPAGPHPVPPAETPNLAWQPADHPGIDRPAPAAASTVDGKPPLNADDRMEATVPASPVLLAQPLDIPLQFSGGDVVSIAVTQSNNAGSLTNQPTKPAADESESAITAAGARISNDNGATKTIQILPLQLGSVDLHIVATFNDGATAQHTYTMNVVPSSSGLKTLNLISGSSNLGLVYQGAPKDAVGSFSPEVVYQQLKNPIPLNDVKLINLHVEQNRNNPVVRLDPDGSVHALRFGETSVTGEFAGVKGSIGVTVYTRQTAPRPRAVAQKPVRKPRPPQ
jgi:hypothetical protein